MKTLTRKRSNCLAAGLFLLIAYVSFGSKALAAADATEVATRILSQRFETIFYASTETLHTSVGSLREASNPTWDFGQPFRLLLDAFPKLNEHPPSGILASSFGVLVGARDFLSPSGFGPVRSLRCYVVFLRDKHSFQLKEYMKKSPVASAAGTSVWEWTAIVGEFGERERRPSVFYGSQIGDSFLIVSNDLNELTTVTEGLIRPHVNEELSKSSPEWGPLLKSDVWAFRRYRHNAVPDPEAAALTEVASTAKTLSLTFDGQNRTAVVRLRCAPGDEPFRKKHARDALPLLRVGPGIWEARFTLTPKDPMADERTFFVRALFGFGAAL
jgi:hypothetical protein